MGATMIDRAKVEAAFVVFSTVFDMKLSNTPVIYPQICTVIPGVSEKVEFKWFGSIPTLKRWIGDRALQRLRGETQTLTTEWWANGIEVDVDDLNNEAKYGMIVKRIRAMAQACARRMDAQTVAFYVDGFAGTQGVTYDNQFLFDTDHTAAGNGIGVAQSNVIVGAFASGTFNSLLERAMEIVDDEGEPIGLNVSKILAGPNNQLALRTVLKQEHKAGGEDNVDAGMATGLISPRITGNHWFGLTDEEIAAVIMGIEVQPQFVSADDPRAYEMFMRRNAMYGSHTKFGHCYGFWQAAFGSTG